LLCIAIHENLALAQRFSAVACHACIPDPSGVDNPNALLAIAKLFLAQNVLTVSLGYPQGAGDIVELVILNWKPLIPWPF
jgi:hypothetical protein